MILNGRQVRIWGDSIMKGIIFDEESRKYRVLENNCVDSFARISGCVIDNHAGFGITTTKALKRMSHYLDQNPPDNGDIVLIEYGGNDCDHNWKEISENPDKNHQPKTPIDVFSDTLQTIIDIYKNINIIPIIMNLPPIEPKRYFKWISGSLNADNILKWLGDINKIYRWQELYNDIVTSIARDNDCPLINVRKSFLTNRNYLSQFCSDGIHPNELGQKNILDSCIAFAEAF